MGDWSQSEIEDIVFGRPVEDPLASGDFLVTQQQNIKNDVSKNTDNLVSKNKCVFWRNEGAASICPSTEIGSSSIAEGLQSKTCSTSNPIGESTGAEQGIDISHLSFDNNSSANSKLTFLENDNDQEKDLLYYDWSDISNFEDVDKMFRNCDPSFGKWSNTDDLSWLSSSTNDIFVPEDTFTSGFESSNLEFRDFNDTSAYSTSIGSLPESSITQVDYHKQSSLTHHSFGLATTAGQSYDGGGRNETKSTLTAIGNVKNMEERKFDQPPIDIKTQQLNWQFSSDVNGKGLQPYPQFLSNQNSFVKSESPSYMHGLNSDAQMQNKLLYQELLLPTTSSTASECQQGPSSYEVPGHVINSTCLSNMPDSLPEDSVMKLEVVDIPSVGSLKLANSVKKQHDNFEQEIHRSGRGSLNLQLNAADIDSLVAQSSSISASFSDDLSLKAISFQQLQDVIGQLDLRTKLCIRDSLYRLARSAEHRHNFAAANTEKVECRRGLCSTGTLLKSAEYMNIETETNPIDRSVAHLLFHRPSEAATRSTDEAMSLESHMM